MSRVLLSSFQKQSTVLLKRVELRCRRLKVHFLFCLHVFDCLLVNTVCHVCFLLVVMVSILTFWSFRSWVQEQTKFVVSADILCRQTIHVQARRENARLSRAVEKTQSALNIY